MRGTLPLMLLVFDLNSAINTVDLSLDFPYATLLDLT